MSQIITVDSVSKFYKVHEKAEGIKNGFVDFFHRTYKTKEAVSDVSFSIEKGQIVGLLGENGAGKSTTLKMLTGILYPSSGTIRVDGYVPTERKKEFLKKICFVMGNKGEIHWDLPAMDTFRYQQLVYEVPEKEFRENVDFLATLLDVTDLLNTQIRRLSLGERMKMELINNFLYSPEVVFLDEPTIGLDLESQIAIRQFIKDYSRKKHATIMITSHYMDDIEETCDRVILLNKGKAIFDGDIRDMKSPDKPFKDMVLGMMREGN